MQIDISESFINKKRISLIKKICGNKTGEELEKAVSNAFSDVVSTLDDRTYKLIDFISKLDNINKFTDENLPSYSVKNWFLLCIKAQDF